MCLSRARAARRALAASWSAPARARPICRGVTAMTYQTIEYQRRGDAVWLWLNRPDALNALSPTLMAEMLQALERAEAEAGIRALVIGGRGRAFCAGGDLKHFLGAIE